MAMVVAMAAARVAEVEEGGEGGASVEGRTFGEDSQLEPLGNERMKLPLAP